jgi:hypothetical protein
MKIKMFVKYIETPIVAIEIKTNKQTNKNPTSTLDDLTLPCSPTYI